MNKERLINIVSEAIESVYNNEKNQDIDGVEETNMEEENPLEDPINHSVGENKQPKKNVYRITENDLHSIIRNTVNKILTSREK